MSKILVDEELVRLYTTEKKSPYEIAVEFNTYANKVRRRLVKLGVPLRSKGEAQSNALKTGRHVHPTKNKTRTEATRIKISESMAKSWADMTNEERERRSQLGKEYWDGLSKADKEKFRTQAAKAIRAAGKKGSKLEQFLYEALGKAGYTVLYHKDDLLVNQKLEIDMFLPDYGIAIEIDGLSHFEPIWGDDALAKQKKADLEKQGLVITNGFSIIRVKHTHRKVSQKLQRDVFKAVIDNVEKLKNHRGLGQIVEVDA